jgi:hypothetical protein
MKNPISNDTRKLIFKKHRLWTRYQETRDRAVEVQYKKIRNKVRKETRETNKNIQRDIAKACKDNPKKLWQFVNSKNKTSRSIGNISISDPLGKLRLIENDSEKAEAFWDHFQKVFTIEPVFDLLEELPQVATAGMPLIAFPEDDIRKKLSKLRSNKSPGPDSLHSRMLYELQNVIPKTLKTIFDHCY